MAHRWKSDICTVVQSIAGHHRPCGTLLLISRLPLFVCMFVLWRSPFSSTRIRQVLPMIWQELETSALGQVNPCIWGTILECTYSSTLCYSVTWLVGMYSLQQSTATHKLLLGGYWTKSSDIFRAIFQRNTSMTAAHKCSFTAYWIFVNHGPCFSPTRVDKFYNFVLHKPKNYNALSLQTIHKKWYFRLWLLAKWKALLSFIVFTVLLY